MLAKVYNSGSRASLFSDEEEAVTLFDGETEYGNGTVALDSEEQAYLYDFFTQEENQLLLEVEGWDIEDADTWSGILWNMEGKVVSMDLSYLHLSGWLDVSVFTALESLNVDGNNISMLALSGCESLSNLSCSYNNLTMLGVKDCENLVNLSCSFNRLDTLDVSGMEKLQNLNCAENKLESLNLKDAVNLSEVHCEYNELQTVDISTNESLNSFFCGNNRIVESENDALMSCINEINDNGGFAQLGGQKYEESVAFNEAELASLTAFADSSLNLEKLGWDLEDPWNWSGVEWKIYGNEYHVASVSFSGIGLEGDFSLPDAEYLESVTIKNASLSSLDLSGCSALSSISCYGAGIDYLGIDGCNALNELSCNENYLAVESVESSLNQIGLQTGIINYESQNILAEEDSFDEAEREALLNFFSIGSNAELLGWDWDFPGSWDGVTWTPDEDGVYRVNKLDFSDIAVTGDLDLTGFDYLEDFMFSGTGLDSVTLPDCVTRVPDYAFYNSTVSEVNLCEGVTTIGEMAFAYCDKLQLAVLPSTVSRVMDKAFYGSALEHAVFLGDEPMESGESVFGDTSEAFVLSMFADAEWSEESALLSEYVWNAVEDEYLILIDSSVSLQSDDAYSTTNSYAGHDVSVIIITREETSEMQCMLAVYNENGSMDEAVMQTITLDGNKNTALFRNVKIQYAGEEGCRLKAFLLEASETWMPAAESCLKVLVKPE